MSTAMRSVTYKSCFWEASTKCPNLDNGDVETWQFQTSETLGLRVRSSGRRRRPILLPLLLGPLPDLDRALILSFNRLHSLSCHRRLNSICNTTPHALLEIKVTPSAKIASGNDTLKIPKITSSIQNRHLLARHAHIFGFSVKNDAQSLEQSFGGQFLKKFGRFYDFLVPAPRPKNSNTP